jgi:NitT/TauT family transport system ATP-binding protein
MDRRFRHGPPRRNRFVFQEPTLMPWARTADNVWLPLRLRGVSKREAMPRIAESLDMVGLSGFADAYPRELSGGMKMRCPRAGAVPAPEAASQDEPFAALDEITRFRLNDDLPTASARTRLHRRFVTHSVYESVYLSSGSS